MFHDYSGHDIDQFLASWLEDLFEVGRIGLDAKFLATDEEVWLYGYSAMIAACVRGLVSVCRVLLFAGFFRLSHGVVVVGFRVYTVIESEDWRVWHRRLLLGCD